MITITAIFQCIIVRPESHRQESAKWSVPFMPWPAAMSIFLNVFLMTTLKKLSYQRFGIWACFITLFYVLYGVHSTYQAEEMEECVDNGVSTNSSIHQTKIDIQVL